MHRLHNTDNPLDTYLDDQNCIQRLVTEYREHKSLVVAFDFDNTVFDYHKKGETYDGVIELLRQAKAANCHLICFTASEDYDFIRKYLAENNIPFDSINENPSFFKTTSPKIYFNILLDDRAGLSAAYKHLKSTLSIVIA